MRQNIWCLLFLIACLTAVLVKSQSFSEVDEDGNEIEVKRFYIEGRQLNGGRRQCVETRRRKRAYNYGQPEDSANDELPSGTAASGIDTAVSLDEEVADKDGNDEAGLIDNDNNANAEQNMAENDNKKDEQNMDEEDKDDEEEEDEKEEMLSLPVIAQITHPKPEESTVGAAAASTAAAAGANGIVISNKPPKVNPQTHAVFEIRPVVQGAQNDNADYAGADYDEGDYDENSQLVYQEEINPVSTTAIWSTGEDDPANYDDYKDGEDAVSEEDAVARPQTKPKPPKKKPGKRPTKRPSKNKNKKNKNQKNKNKRRRPGNKNKHTPDKRGQGNNKRRRQRRPNNGPYQNSNNSNRGQLNNLHAHNQGTRTFSKTDTYTKTGTADDDREVNCIIINKTTTPRPFWGLFGRSANGDAVAPADRPYGRRKRINFSIPA